MNPVKLKEVRLQKLPKRKLFPVDDHYLRKLKNYISKYGIVPNSRVFPITRQRANNIIKKIARECNIRRITNEAKIHYNISPHYFRHSFAIHMLKKNVNNPSALVHVQQLLDHSSIEVTKFYLQFLPYDLLRTINKTFDIPNKEELE